MNKSINYTGTQLQNIDPITEAHLGIAYQGKVYTTIEEIRPLINPTTTYNIEYTKEYYPDDQQTEAYYIIKEINQTQKKGGEAMNEDYKLNYKEYIIIKQIAFTTMQKHNNRIYQDKTIKNKKFINYKQTLKQLMSKDKSDLLYLIDQYQQHKELEQAKKLAIREKQLTQYQEQVDNYFNQLELKKQHSIQKFINYMHGTKEQQQEALNWFRQLTYIQQESWTNQVDNYLIEQQNEIELTSYQDYMVETDAYL